MADNKEIRELARILNLMNITNGVIDIDDEKLSNKEYLYKILKEEINIRNANKLKDFRKQANLPDKKFDHTRITEGLKWQLDKISKFEFTEHNQNIFIVGECATGKTALASEIGSYALDKGARVAYTTLDGLLTESKIKKRLWNRIINADVVIVDEVFYVTPTEEELMDAYKILMFLQETRSIIVITNRPLSSWKDMKVDTHLVETLEKRLMTEAQIITLS